MEDINRYNYMEDVLKNINGNYISLPEEEVKRNNKVLESVLKQITEKMKEKDGLFKKSYTTFFYGGSYYDGLKVGNPEEFDMDLLLKLPKYALPTLIDSDNPGFLNVQFKEFNKWQKQPEAHQWKGLDKLVDEEHYLITEKVSSWIQGVIRKALNDLPQDGNETIFQTRTGNVRATICKGGTAHTLKLSGVVADKTVDIDLVPCFVFREDMWPAPPYRVNPVEKIPDFFVVPKQPNTASNLDRYWRLSFQKQERKLIKDLGNLKPTIRLLKKLRDSLDHKDIASYYIKTIFLWKVADDKDLWNKSLSYVFMTMLRTYKQYLESKNIPDFWNANNNLLISSNEKTLENFANKLQKIIADIERHPEDPFVAAKYLVQEDQLEKLKQEVVIEEKPNKKIQPMTISSGSALTSPQTNMNKTEEPALAMLALAVTKLQQQSDEICNVMENILGKINEIQENIHELKEKNRLLLKKLK